MADAEVLAVEPGEVEGWVIQAQTRSVGAWNVVLVAG